jgi:predicted branched-subunit amino acid permease
MSSVPEAEPPLARAPLTGAGLLLGAKLVLPIVLPISIFGIAVGAVAAQKGMTLVELSVMNALVYAGAAQLVALGLWQESWNWPGIVSIALITLTVNARLLLMSAAFRPWFGLAPAGIVYPALLTLTDANYVAGQRYYAEGGRDIGMFIGAGLLLWIVWIISPIPGFLAGSLIRDARAVGIDLVMPVFFSAMVARLWQGRGDTIGWIAAGAVGYVIHRNFGGSIHVVVGAIVGMAIAAALARVPDAGGTPHDS